MTPTISIVGQKLLQLSSYHRRDRAAKFFLSETDQNWVAGKDSELQSSGGIPWRERYLEEKTLDLGGP